MSNRSTVSRRELLKAGACLGLAAPYALAVDNGMLTRSIPVSGEALPVIGLGTYSVFDVAGTSAEIDARLAILQALLDAGGSVIDSSPMYNRSESVVGQVLARGDQRSACFLATKIWTDGADAGRRQMQQSAERMRAGRLDLVQVHNRRDIKTHWPTILQAQESDQVRYSGVTDYRESANDALQLLMRRYKPDFIQINYSLGERSAERAVLPMAEELGIAVLINRPFVAGRLFRAVGDRPLPGWAREFANSWGQFFLKFIVSHPAVTCVIPATSKLPHMVDNAGAGFGPLPDATTRTRMAQFADAL